MAVRHVSLGDKFDLSKREILLSGVQALVRLTLMQKQRDRDNGLNTAGYVTGYRGSPLGAVDQQFWRARADLAKYDVTFQAGLNEDLAATALWGTQQAEMRGEGKYDGVFGVWYGKGPGVDRSGDVFRHANAAGTSPHGGVLVLMGDDHHAESSTVPHQSEFALMDAMMPILHPAGVQEILDFGTVGIAMSRYSGCWVGLKCVHDNVESTAVVDGSLERVKIQFPADFEIPEGGLNIRPRDDRHQQEKRLHRDKRFAATAFARANGVDRLVLAGGKVPKIGIVSTGKSYLDTRQALDDLGIDEVKAADLGVRLLKIGMVWPLDPRRIAEFAKGLELIVVVEEKRSLIETQIREQLYGQKNAPQVIGKKDEEGRELFAAYGVVEPNQIAIALAERLLGRQQARRKDKTLAERLDAIKLAEAQVRNTPGNVERIPYFCAGCPHNSSTVVPDGGRGYAGIGCHWMVQYIPERHTEGATHMGGEGANWIGEAPFSKRRHVFQNLGDGTYNHSGLLAIRAAIAAGVTMTYKILYNDAVAMTGGQAHEGGMTVSQIARQVVAEGVTRLAVVSDEPDKYAPGDFPAQASFHHRDELNGVQEEMMETDGVSVLIYDQTCAAEKRRRRKRGTFPDPAKRVFINELVCEGCGDCGVQSNCVAIAPVETEFGRKRQIDQSMCNKDFSCLKGFCPSFVTVEGGELKRGVEQRPVAADEVLFEALPEPAQPDLKVPWSVMITGIGGTGVVTVGAILGMAAHLEGKGAGIIDMAGLSQKNGAVVTHMKIAASPADISSIRIAAGGADLLLGCDLVTSASERILAGLARGRTHAVVNDHQVMPAMFTRDADFTLNGEDLKFGIEARVKKNSADFLDATRLATALMGDSIAANLFTLGYAYQKGLIPVGAEAIEEAIRLNAVAVEMNLNAFAWGRRAAHDLKRVKQAAAPDEAAPAARSLEERIALREEFLTAYQNGAYAARYRAGVEMARTAEAKAAPGSTALTEAVARYLFKLMAYKDEYEVARLYTDGSFAREVAKRFAGDYTLKFHLAPPVLAKPDPKTGVAKKNVYGPWMLGAMRVLARLKGLRGTAFDPFGRTAERRTERRLISDYEAMLAELAGALSKDNVAIAAELAGLPEKVRGYGHIKEAAVKAYEQQRAGLLEAFRAGRGKLARAAE